MALHLPSGAVAPKARPEPDWWGPLCSCCTQRDDDYDPDIDGPLGVSVHERSDVFDRTQFVLEHTEDGRDFQECYAASLDEGELGRGACGTVFRAVDRRTGVERAVKVVNKASVKRVGATLRFRREIAIMKILEHPNIARLVETFEDRACVYMVMEFCRGGELFDRIMDLQHLSEPDASAVTFHIFSALMYLHEAKVIHRDLKPENIMCTAPHTKEGDTHISQLTTQERRRHWDVKLIDWGYACQCVKGHVMSTVCGTCYYIAPEVLNKQYGQECDVWSAGVILYILLTGLTPFAGKNASVNIKGGRYQLERVPGIGRDLVDRCLQVDVERRITAEMALQHPFLNVAQSPTRNGASPCAVQMSEVLRSCSLFHRSQKLKRAALTAIAMQKTDEEVKQLRQRFQLIDRDRDGYISEQEMMDALVQGGASSLSPLLLHDIMKAMDTDGSGTVGYVEFLAATLERSRLNSAGAVRQAFRAFDANGDGFIDRRELQRILGSDSMMDEADLNHDGQIDFDEFREMVLSPDASPVMVTPIAHYANGVVSLAPGQRFSA